MGEQVVFSPIVVRQLTKHQWLWRHRQRIFVSKAFAERRSKRYVSDRAFAYSVIMLEHTIGIGTIRIQRSTATSVIVYDRSRRNVSIHSSLSVRRDAQFAAKCVRQAAAIVMV